MARTCGTLGVAIGEFKEISLLGASESIARRSRNGENLSIFEEQFAAAAVMGTETMGFGHHADCQWYRKIITERVVVSSLISQGVELYYKQIERVIQFVDMLESHKWVTKNGWFDECLLTFADNEDWQSNEFSFKVLSPSEISREIKSIKKELFGEFTGEQLACLGVI